ncbi:hypothetical protein BJ742DRAFT_855393 [Cladochytrium replicatum]|nr:hypothetical protein BJ742DRAFT_855393 [Cladochytrium replicatum]
MPLGGLLRNLNRLTVAGVLVSPTSPPSPCVGNNFQPVEVESSKKPMPLRLSAEEIVDSIDLVKGLVEDGGRLVNAGALKKARIHPLELLVALKTYGSGKGVKGSLVWTPIPEIVDELERAFALSFEDEVFGAEGGVQQLGGRVLVAIDHVQRSRCRTEPNVTIVGFSDELVRLPITRTSTFREAIKAWERLPFSATDCALPMTWALERGMDVNTFIVLTDETWKGDKTKETSCNDIWAGDDKEILFLNKKISYFD